MLSLVGFMLGMRNYNTHARETLLRAVFRRILGCGGGRLFVVRCGRGGAGRIYLVIPYETGPELGGSNGVRVERVG